MLKKLSKISETKVSWVLLLAGSSILLFLSLYFQHVLKLEPCILCIYQRIAIMGIIIASLVGLLSNYKNKIIRNVSYFIWILSSSFGLWAALSQWRETYIAKTTPFYMSQCGQGLERFIPSLEHYKILSDLFIAKGICSEITWRFLGLAMHNYLSLIFGLFLICGILFLTANLKNNDE